MALVVLSLLFCLGFLTSQHIMKEQDKKWPISKHVKKKLRLI